jgi:hypothetical protein
MESPAKTDPAFPKICSGKKIEVCSGCSGIISDQSPFGWCPHCLLARVSPALSRSEGLELEVADLDREFSGRYEFQGFIERGATRGGLSRGRGGRWERGCNQAPR